jgi:preprotein translocase subunit SecF
VSRLRETLSDIYHERTNFQFIDRSWRWALLSGTLVLVSLVSLGVRGLNLSIDFDGGTQWQLTVAGGSASIDEVRDVLAPVGQGDAKVLIIGDDGLRVQSDELQRAEQEQVTQALADYGGIEPSEVSVTDVGPTWGSQVSEKALIALGVFFALIAAYLTFRFEWKMALAAIVAVVHDIIVTVGVYAITGFEVTPATVIAFLTILGFSLYDTVVVFDKVKENTPTVGTERGDTYSRMVNRSMNRVLMRSLNTSFVALLPVASLLVVGTWVLGAVTLRDFGLALFVGLLIGAYSSIFVATPILAWLKEKEPRYRAVRERATTFVARAERAPAPASVGAAATPPGEVVTRPDTRASSLPGRGQPTDRPSRGGDHPVPSTRPSPGLTSGGTGGVAPRPRQQRRRKRRR